MPFVRYNAPMSDTGIVLSWSAYEHEHIERGGDWFWALGITAACIALTAILFGDALFGLLVVIAAATLGLLATHPPELTEFVVDDRGIRVGRNLHRWDDVISFWIEEESGAPLLLVDTTAFTAPNLIIPLTDVDTGAVRTLMGTHADEVFMREPISHKILEFFGF